MKKPAAAVVLNRLLIQALLAYQDRSANDLANYLHISHQYLSEILYGRRNATLYLSRIAAYLEVDPRKITSKFPHTGRKARAKMLLSRPFVDASNRKLLDGGMQPEP
jgi:transcriptional regulator with XRE-family HTH domain